MRNINHATVHLLGYASGLGGVNAGCAEGPLQLQKKLDLAALGERTGVSFVWEAILRPALSEGLDKAELIQNLTERLASYTAELTKRKEFFIVTGGDHTSAIGTWSGVSHALGGGALGLIWMDAHMDSHVPATSVTGRFHGMPLAALLGQGNTKFTQLMTAEPKIKPENLCLIGVRSYEEGEAELLKRLKVRVYFIEEVKKRGLSAVFQEALSVVNQNTVGFGLSLDVDSIDPEEAPGVDVPEPDGLRIKEVCEVLSSIAKDPRLLGVEMVEFNPEKDREALTEKGISQLIAAITGIK